MANIGNLVYKSFTRWNLATSHEHRGEHSPQAASRILSRRCECHQIMEEAEQIQSPNSQQKGGHHVTTAQPQFIARGQCLGTAREHVPGGIRKRLNGRRHLSGAGSSTGTESSDSNSWTERIEVASEQVIDTLKKLISEGNVRRVTLRKSNGKKLISVPMTAGAAIGGVAVLAAPMITAIAAVTALVTKVTLEIERTDDPENANSEGSDSIVQAEIVHDDPTDK